MQCPNCTISLPASARTCPQCNQLLRQPRTRQRSKRDGGDQGPKAQSRNKRQATQAAVSVTRQVPLTRTDRRSLRTHIVLPIICVIGMFCILGYSILPSTDPLPGPFYLAIAAMAGMILFPAIRVFRDIFNGYALQEAQRVTKLRRTYRNRAVAYLVYLENNQCFRVDSILFNSMRQGEVYQFTYAPLTKIVFKISPVAS